MIVTLTANPSFDRTIALSSTLERGGVLRADSVLEQAGGKGVNISRVASLAGVASVAVFPAAADSPFTAELESQGITCRAVTPTGPTRVNLTLTEPDGTTTKVNSSGSDADAALLTRLRDAVQRSASSASWVVLAGSLPPGTPEEWYAEVATALAGSSAKVAVDTSERPLLALADRLGAARPAVLKPNAEELCMLTGDDPAAVEADPVAAATAARRLVADGAGAVLLTLGGAGAVLVDGETAWHATPPPVDVVSTVGAGDSSLFGYVLGDLRGLGPADRLRLAVAYGSAAAGLPGTTMPSPDQTRPEAVAVRPLPLEPLATPGARRAAAAQHLGTQSA